MYGKLFAQMYDGTLGTKGPWQALVTFQQLVILADKQGVVDMTTEAISRRTTIPLEIITEGIKALEQPDPQSRSPALEGRRIERLNTDRDWGWSIVNYARYRAIRTQDDRREYMKMYQRQRRALVKSSTLSTSGKQSQPIAEAEAEADTKVKGNVGLSPDAPPLSSNSELRKQASEIVLFLNKKTGRSYEPKGANLDFVIARLKDGETTDDLRAVIAKKCREWQGDSKMAQYLRPATLFNRTKFAQYKGELVNV